MNNSGLLFIPDISGFTRFVNATEIEHSRYIIGELLENIINSNQLGLTVSEIEGDAVLFYRFGESPSLQEIYLQVETMFCNFQKQIKSYEIRRACQCSACLAAINLSLKIISHYGEFSTYMIKNDSKLIGKDVIIAHQLLKNDIDIHEYWLVTNDLVSSKQNDDQLPPLGWQHGNKLTAEGEVVYYYSLLSALKEKVQPDPLTELELGEDKVKVISRSKTINAHPVTVLSLLGNFSLRPQWMEGIKGIDQVSHPINHVGVKHRELLEDRTMIFYSSSFGESEDGFSYSETDDKKTIATYFTVKPLPDRKTLLTIDHYLKKDIFKQLSFSLFSKKKLSRRLARSLDNLERLSQQPGMGYPADVPGGADQ